MSYSTNFWYLLYTKPNQEKKVSIRLSEQNINIYLPVKKVLREWHDRKKTIEMPLFPGYVFVKPQNSSEFFHCQSTLGVSCFVKIGSKPATVSQDVINGIDLVLSNSDNVEVSTACFYPGKKMLIKQGALKGLMCETIKHQGRHKVLVRVNLLNRSLLVDLPDYYLDENIFERLPE